MLLLRLLAAALGLQTAMGVAWAQEPIPQQSIPQQSIPQQSIPQQSSPTASESLPATPADIPAGVRSEAAVVERVEAPAEPVPEPNTLFLVGTGLVGVALTARWRRKPRA